MIRLPLFIAALSLAAATTAHAATSATIVIHAGPQPVQAAPVFVQPPPPPPRYEPVPRARRGMVWSQGHWEWRGRQYVWLPGQWLRVRPGQAYRQPHWVQRSGQWVFVAGGWGRHDMRRGPRQYTGWR